jgi:hypothetical protein
LLAVEECIREEEEEEDEDEDEDEDAEAPPELLPPIPGELG